MQKMFRQVWILAGSQAIFQTVSILVMTIGGLAGEMLAPSPALATLPIAAVSLGTVMATFPASIWMSRAGRKKGFCAGAAAGVIAGFLSVTAMSIHSFTLLCVATFMVGIYQAFAQFYRFAASEAARKSYRTRAISLVMAGGIVAALLGPLLANLGSNLFNVPYLGSFLLMGIMALSGLALLSRLQMPQEDATRAGEAVARHWLKVIIQPSYAVALFSAASAFGIMVLAMTATPLAMKHHDYSLTQSATVIQIHVLGMFLPSFFTGRLIERFGVTTVMLTGAVVLVLYILLAISGTKFSQFAGALFLVGLGWNFLYIGGTSLLATSFTHAEKGIAQAINDMSIFVSTLLCSLAAGKLLSIFGWKQMNLLLLPWVLFLMILLAGLVLRNKHAHVRTDVANRVK
ncbi:MFS transporter [Cronobacter sakazakii]